VEAPQVPQGHQLLEEPTPPPTLTVTRRSCRSWWGFSTIQRRPLPLGQQVPQVPLVEELKVPQVHLSSFEGIPPDQQRLIIFTQK